MSIRSLPRSVALAAAFAIGTLHATAHAWQDWVTVAPACTPDSMQTVQFELVDKAKGMTRAGRNPPLAYLCPVWNPDDFTTTPPWSVLKLMYIDPTPGGAVKARLYQKNRTTGQTKVIAVASSTTSAAINTVSATIKVPMNFALNGYYVTLDLITSSLPVEAHMVMLTN